MGPRAATRTVVLVFALALIFGCAPAPAAPAVSGEFEIASEVEGSNDKIVAGPDGNIWLTIADPSKDVARVTPAGQVTEFEVRGAERPKGIAAGPDGRVWLSQEGGVVGFFPSEPASNTTVVEQKIPDIGANSSIVAGPDGLMWVVTENHLISVPPSDPSSFKSTEIPNLFPHDIDVAASRLAIADSGQPRIVTVGISGGKPVDEQDFAISGGSQGVAGNAAGQVAYSDPLATPSEQIGLITPPNPAQTTDLKGDPFGVALGSDGAFWIAQAATPFGVTRLTTGNQSTHLDGFAVGFKPRQITAGPDNTLWVILENEISGEPSRVGRISGLEPPTQPAPLPAVSPPIGGGGGKAGTPETKLAKGPKRFVTKGRRRAKVRFEFSSPQKAAIFQCALMTLRRGKKPKPPGFKKCASPKVFKLKPGRYRFQVRAVLAGAVDPSPASATIRVVHKG